MSRVLVIDDCDEFREIVGELLSDAGYEVVLASGPAEARVQWEKQHFQMIMCDLVMPVEDNLENVEDTESAMVGVHTIHELSKSFPGVPVVAVSGKLTGEPLSVVNKFGAFATLSKPFSRDELMSVVERALAKNNAAVN